jgi:hypothetical protein
MKTVSIRAAAALAAAPIIAMAAPAQAQTGLYLAPGSGFVSVGGGASQSNAKAPGFGNVSVRPAPATFLPVTVPTPTQGTVNISASPDPNDPPTTLTSTAYGIVSSLDPPTATVSTTAAFATPGSAFGYAVAGGRNGNFTTEAFAQGNGRSVSTAWGGDSALTFPIGWFADLQLSRGLAEPFLGAFNIVQFDLTFTGAAARRSSYGLSVRSADGYSGVSFASTDEQRAGILLGAWSGEATMKYKALQKDGAVVSGYRLDTFVGLSRTTDTVSLAGGIFSPDPGPAFQRDLEIVTAWAGVGIGGEASVDLADATSLFIGGGAGGYLAYAHGDFSNTALNASFTPFPLIPAAHVKDNDVRAGVKLSAETGVRVQTSPDTLTTLTVGATYRSAVAQAEVPTKAFDAATHIGWADEIAYTAGLRMSFRTQ